MNEWGFAGEIKSWWDQLIAIQPELGLGRVTIEESAEGESTRADLTLYEQGGSQLMVLELRLPDHANASPVAMDNIHNAMNKAISVGARWSATSDGQEFRLLDHSRHEIPLRERAVPVAPLARAADRAGLDVPAVLASVRASWEDLLVRLAPFLTGREAAPVVPPDEFFVDSLQASLARPFAETRNAILERQSLDVEFSNDLIRWMVDKQGWLHDAQEFQTEITRVAQVVTYVFATRLLFHGALGRAQSDLPKLELPHSGNPGLTQVAVKNLFSQAREVTGDYETVFVFDEICKWALISKRSCLGWVQVLEVLENFQLETISFDVLGRLFERLIDPHERYEWGQHYTSPDVVDLMLSAALPDGDGLVYDPASGGGTFLVRAYARKRAYKPDSLHNDRLREIAGGDVSAFAASVSTISLASQDLGAGSNYPQVRVGSFFTAKPNEAFVSLPDGQGGYEARQIDNASAVVCNPPYIGYSNIGWRDNEAKVTYRADWPKLPALKNRYNYHLYFWFHAATFLREEGRMAFITSGEWLDSDYGVQLQQWLLGYFHIELVIESMAEQWFGEARVGTVVLVIRKLPRLERIMSGSTSAAEVRFVTLRKRLGDLYGYDATDDTLRLLSVDAFRDRLMGLRGHGQSEDYDFHTVRQTDLLALGADATGRYLGSPWRSRFLRSPSFAHVLDLRDDYEVLNRLATVQLGAKTGADKFFFVKVDRPGLGKCAVRGLNGGWHGVIGNNHLRAALQNPKDLDHENGRRFVVRAASLPGRYFAPKSGAREAGVKAYVQAGEEFGIHQLPLVMSNADGVWYRQNRTVVTSSWALPYNSALDYFAVDNTSANAVLNGRFIGVEARSGVDSDLLGAVLNSTFTVVARLMVGVATGNEGAYDVGPPAARAMRIPNPGRFSVLGTELVRNVLARIRREDKILGAPAVNGNVHPLRRELDMAILAALGETPGDSAVLLDTLYASYGRWRQSVQNVEGQVRLNRRALDARGGARNQDPMKRVVLSVFDEVHDGKSLGLVELAEDPDVQWCDAVNLEAQIQDALFEVTTVRTSDGTIMELSSPSRVDFITELRSLGWPGPVPVPNADVANTIVQRIRRCREAIESGAQDKAAAYVSISQVPEVIAEVLRRWSLREIGLLKRALAVSRQEVRADEIQNASLFEPDGLVPPAPKA